MMFPTLTAAEKRKNFRDQLKTGKLLQFPGSFSPLVSMMIEQKGFVYPYTVSDRQCIFRQEIF